MMSNKQLQEVAGMMFGEASLFLRNVDMSLRNTAKTKSKHPRSQLASQILNPQPIPPVAVSIPTGFISQKKKITKQLMAGMVQGHSKPIVSLIQTQTSIKETVTKKNLDQITINVPIMSKRDKYASPTKQQQILRQRRFTFDAPLLPSIKQSQRKAKFINRQTISTLIQFSPSIIKYLQIQQQQNIYKSCPIDLSAQAYCLIDVPSKKIIYKHFHQQVKQMASLTKIMTCITCLLMLEKYHISLGTRIRVSDQAGSIEGTIASLKPGDLVTIQGLLYGLMLPSGNDAALVLAEYFGKIIYKCKCSRKQYLQPGWQKGKKPPAPNYLKNFYGQMNKLARQLNLQKSTFASPHGLSNQLNVSTAYDLCLLSAAALQHLAFAQIVLTKVYTCSIFNQRSGLSRTQIWTNSNKLLKQAGYQGIKTGNTPAAGPCFAGYYRGQKQMVCVVLNCSSSKTRFKQTQKIVQAALKQKD